MKLNTFSHIYWLCKYPRFDIYHLEVNKTKKIFFFFYTLYCMVLQISFKWNCGVLHSHDGIYKEMIIFNYIVVTYVNIFFYLWLIHRVFKKSFTVL